jgi:hypothetical protein
VCYGLILYGSAKAVNTLSSSSRIFHLCGVFNYREMKNEPRRNEGHEGKRVLERFCIIPELTLDNLLSF